jgi:hypothetical protein
VPGSAGFAGAAEVFGFQDPLADRLDLITERTEAMEGAIGTANQAAHGGRMAQPESR